MEIRLKRETLVAELTLLQGIVERRTTIPILSHILLQASADRLDLAATDLDVSLSTWVEASVDQPGSIAIQAKKFTEIVRSLTDDEVELAVADGTLTIKAGRSRFSIRGLDAENFPTLPAVDADEALGIPLARLKRMVGKVIFAISAEESRFQLNGALFQLGSDALSMVATDGHRLALVSLRSDAEGVSIPSPQDGVLVPRKALQELVRFDGDGTVAYRRSEHHLSFRLDRRELTCRILEGTFPDYERVIARDHELRPTIDTSLLQRAVSRVALLTGERSRGVLLHVSEGTATVSAANPDLGEAMEQVACEYEGAEVKVGLNPDYLGQFLSAVETESVRLELKDGESQCVGFPESETPGELEYLCVIMPMHI